MILDDDQALLVLNTSKQVPPFITKSREDSRELFALIEGDGFDEELISRIEFVEGAEKAKARKKYSRDITPFFEKLLRPVDNVYSATGFSKNYDIDDEKKKINLMSKISRIRSGKSLQEWLRTNWMPLYHSDPNGVVFMEYESGDNPTCWPTYQNITHIRNYKARGQMVEWILFEPRKFKTVGGEVELWRLVDDVTDRTYKLVGDVFTLLEEFEGRIVTFEHPFGQTPALINSDIEKLKGNHRLSPVYKIVELSKEYARDQSVKTIYKAQNGFPTEWKYEDQCMTCQGAGKISGKDCEDCDGHGYNKSKDVTDIKIIATPTKDDVPLNPFSGYVTPPLEIWVQYDSELKLQEDTAHETHWGTILGAKTTGLKTATEIVLNIQPMTDRLNIYSDVAEMMEEQLTEWTANLLDPRKPKDERIANINYGRNYIINPPDVILKQYENAKKEGDNNVILDRLLNEYYTAKHSNDPAFLRITILKSDIEPYVHLSVDQVSAVFGLIEAQRKVLFEDWWKTLSTKDLSKSSEVLRQDFDNWFEEQQPEGEEKDADTLANQAKLRGSVGGVTGIIAIIGAVSMGQMSVDSAVSILIDIYGLTEEVAKSMIGNPTVIPPAPTTGGGRFN